MVRNVINVEPVCLWEAGATLGEGALWHAPSESVYFVDIKGRCVHRCAPDGSRRRVWIAPRQVGFIVPAEDGGFVCGLQGGLYRFDERVGDFAPLLDVEPDMPANRINDGYVDAQGRLWFGTMDDGEAQPTGSLYRVGPDGVPVAADRDYIITNGPATSPDGRTLYHTDTLGKKTYAFDVQPDGSLSSKRLFASYSHKEGYPDGMAVDAEGFVWIAFFGGWRIDRYSPRGELVSTVRFPCSNITKLAFGGPDLRTVYVTTARKGLSVDELQQQPLAGGLFTFRSDVAGLPGNAFRLASETPNTGDRA
jgi:sugar lactone lactonase YvrE